MLELIAIALIQLASFTTPTNDASAQQLEESADSSTTTTNVHGTSGWGNGG